jgi:glycine C-acetyltransferase
MEVFGEPSAIVSVKVGDEAFARIVSRLLPERGVIANLVEFPAVAKGSARFRLQVMATHAPEHIQRLMERFLAAVTVGQTLHGQGHGAAAPTPVLAEPMSA